jgi:hypothetical protein
MFNSGKHFGHEIAKKSLIWGRGLQRALEKGKIVPVLN